jgi:hypothetical protein
MNALTRGVIAGAALGASLLAAPAALADDGDRTLCVYDPAGKSGEFFRMAEDFAVLSSTWGNKVSLQAYTDEEVATKDYETGKCDGVFATGVRLQRFNRYTSTIEAIGAITDYPLLGDLIRAFVKYPSSAKSLISGEHETAGIMPAGLVYLFLRDRQLDTVEELAGKRIATMDYDKAAPVMVDRVGAIMVPADLGSFGPKFNNGNVDACYMSAIAYEAFELWNGMEPSGGVVKLPLAMGTIQLLVRRDRFASDFGTKSRAWFASQYDRGVAAVKKEEAKIPEKYWIEIPPADMPGFSDMFQQVRIDLRDKHGAYDGSMLSALRKLRCARDAARSECVEKKE